MNAPTLVFLDVETTGLDGDDQIWELVATLRRPGRPDATVEWWAEHDFWRAERLPEPFLSAYRDRWEAAQSDAGSQRWFARQLVKLFTAEDGSKPFIVGACPWFDAGLLARVLADRLGIQRPPWHHRLRCVESLVMGHLGLGEVRGLSHAAELMGVPVEGAHTALGDVRMTVGIWDAVMAAKREESA
jgi:hypothetical protein